ncbi:MAG: hypothetical protein GX575_07730 [Candidatus Anammoximicrobium sp.]|nr:hypothetical protein [Candidatus Anammoximicrobium sp.]
MNGKQRDDLDWLAFRYVAAELSPAESREFESRLEHDQQAREAVGRLVEVTCAIRSLEWNAVPRVERGPRSCPWYRRRGVQVIGGLALGLGLVVALAIRGARNGESELDLAAAPPAAELAVVWIAARTEVTARQVEESAGWRWLAPADREPDSGSPMAAGWLADSAADTPDWMVMAVAAMESGEEDQHGPASDVKGI